MRSAPASSAASKTFCEPSTLIAWLADPAPMIAKARCTTTSAPFTASRTLRLSCTSPCRYSAFFQPWLAGSNARRAIPTIFFTWRERSRAETSAMPRSPVGPVTATVRPSVGTAGVVSDRRSVRRRRRGAVLAAAQAIEAIRPDGVLAGAAAHPVSPAVRPGGRVAPLRGGDALAAAPAGHAVGPAAGDQLVVA